LNNPITCSGNFQVYKPYRLATIHVLQTTDRRELVHRQAR